MVTEYFVVTDLPGKILAHPAKRVYNKRKLREVTVVAKEYEFKFRASHDAMTSLCVSSFPRYREVQMETTYYDTPSGALSGRRYTLRKRKENDKYICTLKTPAPEAKEAWNAEVTAFTSIKGAINALTGSVRNEWEVECDRIESAIPLLIEQGAPMELAGLAAEGLTPICGAKFTRLIEDIHLAEADLEMAMDFGYLIGGNKSEPFYEVELELKSGDKIAAARFANHLAQNFWLERETESKFARALKLYKGE